MYCPVSCFLAGSQLNQGTSGSLLCRAVSLPNLALALWAMPVAGQSRRRHGAADLTSLDMARRGGSITFMTYRALAQMGRPGQEKRFKVIESRAGHRLRVPIVNFIPLA
jgi:hypothetical protein